jgi:hypothetical protein
MGSFTSKYQQIPDDSIKLEIENLRRQMVSIQNIDKNNDNVVTKDELFLWKKDQDIRMVDFEQRIRESVKQEYIDKLTIRDSEIQSLKLQLDELEKQNTSLKSINESLNNKVDEKIINIKNEYTKKLSEMSKTRINEYVQKILNDQNTNIKYLPDFVEKQIYYNVFTMLIKLMDHVFEKTSIDFLGHKIGLTCEPLNKPLTKEIIQFDVTPDTDEYIDDIDDSDDSNK